MPHPLTSALTAGSSDILASQYNSLRADAFAMRNLLTNPGFEVWQRGAGAFTANNAFTADRWRIFLQGTSTVSITRDTANVDTNSQYCAALAYVHNTASALTQKVEDYFQLRGRTIIFTARVKTTTASACRLSIETPSSTYTNGSYHSGGGAYETLSVSVAVGASATYVQVQFSLDASATVYVDSAVVTIVGATTDTAPEYVPLHPADDLARCQRYYEVHGALNGAFTVRESANGAHDFGQATPFAVPKGGTPTVTKNGTWAVTNAGQPSIGGASAATYDIYAGASGAGAALFACNGTDDYVDAVWTP